MSRVDAQFLTEADRSLGEAERNLSRAQDALRFSGALDSGAPVPLLMTPRVKIYRDHLLAQNGMNTTLADMTIDHLLRQGAHQQVRAAALRVELAKLDGEIVDFNAVSRSTLAPLETEVERLATATTTAVAALDTARIAREAEFNATLGRRRVEIMSELAAPHRPEYQSEWLAPKPGESPNAVMVFPDGH